MRSDAQRRADRKYNAKRINEGIVKRINLLLKIADDNLITNYGKELELSKTQIIIRAVNYCHQNNIDLRQIKSASDLTSGQPADDGVDL